MVVFFHVYGVVLSELPGSTLWPGFSVGRVGVEYFFVLSGFIIFYVARRDIGAPQRLPWFYGRRALRILPLYWVVLFGLMLGKAVLGLEDDAETGAGRIIAAIFVVPTGQDQILDVAWTLSHEFLFYLLFGTLFLSRRGGALVLGLWGIGSAIVVVRGAFGGLVPDFPLSFVFSPYNLLFSMGLYAAWVFERLAVARAIGLLVGGLVALGAIATLDVNHGHLFTAATLTVLYGSGFACVIAGGAALDKRLAPTFPRGLILVGDASYSIYLIHGPVIVVLALGLTRLGLLVRMDDATRFFVYVAVAITAGVICHVILERRLLQLARRSAR